MDHNLILVMDKPGSAVARSEGVKVRFVDESTGEIEVERLDGGRAYKLKPLAELFGQGYGITSFSMLDRRFEPLLMCIETEIANHYRADESLTDGQVSLALRKLSMNPAADCGNDVLARRIQLGLRLFLSLNDHSRQEVKLAIRKVAQSVEWHTNEAGPRGYLSFILDYV